MHGLREAASGAAPHARELVGGDGDRRPRRAVPVEDRAHAGVRSSDYGQAGAFQRYGRDLPPVACGHNSYWLWGPGDPSPEVEVRLLGQADDEGDHSWMSVVYVLSGT